MACFGQSITAFSAVPSRNSQSQESEHAAETEVLRICARAGVGCVGIAADRVLFQPTVTTLSIPLAEFRDAAKAVALIRAKLAEVQR